MTAGPRLWFLAMGLSIGLHGAAFATLSFCTHGTRGAPPHIMLPPGQAAGIPVMLVAAIEPEGDELPRLDESEDETLTKSDPVTISAHAPDPVPLTKAVAVAATTAAEAVTEAISAGATRSLADGRSSPGGAPGVLAGPAPAATNQPPAYPAEARRKRQAGTVILRVVIEPDGHVARATVARSSGFELLDRAALDAARGWRFIPANDGGAAVRCEAELPVEFVLRAP